VTEQPEIAEAGIEAAAGIDPAAIGLALGVASPERADAFLEEQTRLVRLQAEELSHELDVRRWSLWVRHLSGLLKLTFEIGLAIVALGVACFIAAAWNAAHAEGLIIEPFSVPPDLANRGITGQVVASQMLDQLTMMQRITQSARPGRSYANSWGDDLKVEIPETGVSIGEAYRFLRRWLGHETHVSGEVVRTPNGIAITARTDGSSGTSFRGPDSELDALIVRSAGHIYRMTQPDRYARYLFFPRPGLTRPRFGEARAILDQMARDAPASEKRWAWIGLAVMARFQRDYTAARNAYRNVTNADSLVGPALMEAELSRPEYALSAARTVQRRLDRASVSDIDPSFMDGIRSQIRETIALLLADYQEAAKEARTPVDQTRSGTFELAQGRFLHILSLLHDGTGVRAYWDGRPSLETPMNKAQWAVAHVKAEGELGHYQAVVALEPDAEITANAVGETFIVRDTFARQLRPLLALAKAKTGNPAGAQALIAASPLDCYDCLRIRALIAAEAKQPQQADSWFARAVRDAPSIPRAYSDWGKVLLERGQPDGAIAKFRQANERGPHFSDPLEGWGEALMAKNQSHLALAKFAQANQYAPNWGRLHLKWGEALVYVGEKAEAEKHFARAAQLDLTPSEKSELARSQAVATNP
jgi:tetratricopeptide (TPR) repeat protein